MKIQKPKMTPLPIDAFKEAICDLVLQNKTVVLKASPGTGKTTRVPRMLADEGLVKGKIVVLEPRRLAARLSAERVAFEAGTRVGEFCGYQIRYDKQFSSATQIVSVTEGIFIRWLTENPNLDGIGAVILDEFHERNLQTDMALAFVLNCQRKSRPDLKLLIMSATLDTRGLEKHLGSCGVIDIPGKTYPTSIEYAPPKGAESLNEATAAAAIQLLGDPRSTGNILVFQSGAGAIQQTVKILQTDPRVKARAVVLPLYSSLSVGEQEKVFQESAAKKIIVSTNVAETSLTLPNITGVVDNGFSKVAGHTPWSGMPTLEERRISQASAIQRAGRAGRTAPGVVIRTYKEVDYLRSEAFALPDIKKVDLSGALLQVMAAAEAAEPESNGDVFSCFPWYELPEDRDIDAAYILLMRLGCVDQSKILTERGRRVSCLPLHPRLGAILEAAKDDLAIADIVAAVCIIAEEIFVSRREPARERSPSDISLRLNQIKAQLFDLDWAECEWSRPIPKPQLDRYTSLLRQIGRPYGIPGLTKDRSDCRAISRALLVGYADRVAKIRRAKKEKIKKKFGEKQMLSFCLGRGGEIAE